jgi:hypothetical protein
LLTLQRRRVLGFRVGVLLGFQLWTLFCTRTDGDEFFGGVSFSEFW